MTSIFDGLQTVSKFGAEGSKAVVEEEEGDDTDEMLELDCPICLDPMQPADHAHALQCHCGYNFCQQCIKSLIHSSKDDFMEASDGNMHVKVYLHCPNCRNDLSESIRDTLLLRTVHFTTNSTVHTAQEELTDSQKRLKRALENDPQARKAIQEALQKEANFFGLQHVGDDSDIYNEPSEEEKQDSKEEEWEEWGVEADLIRGAHESFRFPLPPLVTENAEEGETSCERKLLIDKTLLQGLEGVMSLRNKEFLTELLTSGKPFKLAVAADTLRELAYELESGHRRHNDSYRLSGRVAAFANKAENESQKKILSRRGARSSIYELISSARRARDHVAHATESSETGHTATIAAAASSPRQHRMAHRELEMELRREAEYLRLHPLPVRMPKCVELPLSNPSESSSKTATMHTFNPLGAFICLPEITNSSFPLTFCNDTWDGTVMDAFSKITIGRRGNVVKKDTLHKNVGVCHILGGSDKGRVQVDVERPRVLVASVQGAAGRQGVLKGDVVTHLNGQEFHGNADDLVDQLQSLYNRVGSGEPPATFKLVLNAERSIAEALKRRSLAD